MFAASASAKTIRTGVRSAVVGILPIIALAFASLDGAVVHAAGLLLSALGAR